MLNGHYDPAQGQNAIKAAIKAAGLTEAYEGGRYVFVRGTGQVADMAPGLDVTGTGSASLNTCPVVQVFGFEALRDDDGCIVCAVPGRERFLPEGWVWVLAGDVQCARAETVRDAV